MSELPLTLVITTRNRPALLRESLESVNLAFPDRQAIQLCVVDDGDGNSAEASALAFGARYERTAAGSPGNARNFGLALVETEYVAFLDDDDAIRPGAFHQQLRALEQAPHLAVAFTAADLVDDTLADAGLGSIPDGYPRSDGDWRYHLFHDVQVACAVFRASMLRAAGGFDPRLRYCEDSHLMARLAARQGVQHVEGTASLFRQRASDARAGGMLYRSFCDRKKALGLLASEGLRLSFLERLRWHRVHRGYSASLILQSGLLHARDGARLEALRELAWAVKVSPVHTLSRPPVVARLLAAMVAPPGRPASKHQRPEVS